MIITIPGKPVGKARPKFRRAGFKVITYTPPATKKYEKEVARIYKQSAGVLYTEIPLRVCILAKFPIPESWSKKNKEKALKGEIKPNKKPDLDNIAKIILDGLNGVAYTDDKQVTSLEIEKSVLGHALRGGLYWRTEECFRQMWYAQISLLKCRHRLKLCTYNSA